MLRLWSTLMPFFECNRPIVEEQYVSLPWEQYFEVDRLFEEVISETTLAAFAEYITSISAYNAFKSETTLKDPLQLFLIDARDVLQKSGKRNDEIVFPLKRLFVAYRLKPKTQ